MDDTKVINELVLITWIDAEARCDWADAADVYKWSKAKFTVREVGWVLEDNKDHIVLTSQLGDENLIGNRTRIPKPWILERKTIKRENERTNTRRTRRTRK